MRRPLRLWFAMFLAGCGGNQVACENPATTQLPQDCAALASASWRIGPFPTTSETDVRVEVGGSRALFLDPFVESECAGSVVSVTWSVEDESVATVVPKDPARRGSWVNGLVAGRTAVRARIVFSDGTAQDTAARAIQIVAPAPPTGSVVVAEGTLELEARNANSSSDFERYIPFIVPAGSGQMDVSLNWGSPLNRVYFALFAGECSGGAGASCAASLRYIGSPNTDNVKPVVFSVRNPVPDIYTVRIDNSSLGAETARYEVRITPN